MEWIHRLSEIILLAGVFAISQNIFAGEVQPPEVEWERAFGGGGNETGLSVQQTTDGGFIISGTIAWPGRRWDVYLIKTDGNGKKVWHRTFGGEEDDFGTSVRQTTDGGYIIAGDTQSFGAGKSDVYLIKTDGNGKKTWHQTFGGAKDDYARSVRQTTDGGYIIAGSSNSFGAGKSNVYLIKTDGNGKEVWHRTFGGEEDDFGTSVRQTTDGGYIIAGDTQSFGAGKRDVYVIKTDGNGKEVWHRTVGGDDYDWATLVEEGSNGGYRIAGGSYSFGTGKKALFSKIGRKGNDLWLHILEGHGYDCAAFTKRPNGGSYIVVGGNWPAGRSGRVLYLTKTDKEGKEVSLKSFVRNCFSVANSVQLTRDGGYIIVGKTYSPGDTNDNVYLVKVAGSAAK